MQRTLLQVMGLRSCALGGPTAAQRRVAEEVIDLYSKESWLDLKAMDADAKRTAEEILELVPQWAGTIYLCLCDCYRSLGCFDEAFEQSDNALASFEKLDDCIGQGKTLNCIGSCYLVMGQYAQACEQYYKALDIFKKLNDRNGQRTALSGLGNCKLKLGDYPSAIDLFQQDHALVELGDCIGQGKTLNDLGNCYLKHGQHSNAKKMFEESLAIAEKLSDRAARGAVQGPACDGLGRYYESRSEYKMAIKQHNKALAIHIELCDRFGQGCSYNNLGLVLANSGDGAAAADALTKGIVVWQRMEQDVGAPDARRVSVFEEQQRTYRMLQNVLLRQGAARWALGVAAESKGRALAYALRAGAPEAYRQRISRLGAGGGGDGDDGGDQSVDRPYKVWWAKVQGLARAEGAATRVLEYSFFSEDRMAIWVVSGDTGELLCSKVVKWTGVGVSRGRSIQQVLKEARSSMNVRGRDAMSDSAPDAVASSSPGVPDAESAELPEELQSTDADAASAQRAPAKDDQGRKLETLAASQASKRAAEMAREVKLLQELYQALIAPVEGALEGAEELLIVPHDLLFEVPWAALLGADGCYLIERYVIRTAPSLRVARKAAEARQAADKMQQHAKQPPPRVVLVGNPLPTRLPSLRFAEKEVLSLLALLVQKYKY
jgi:tetratricopeptide (TPR) repeat protein